MTLGRRCLGMWRIQIAVSCPFRSWSSMSAVLAIEPVPHPVGVRAVTVMAGKVHVGKPTGQRRVLIVEDDPERSQVLKRRFWSAMCASRRTTPTT